MDALAEYPAMLSTVGSVGVVGFIPAVNGGAFSLHVRNDRLAAGTITFSSAAELAGMSVREFARLAKERDVTWVADDHLGTDLEAL